VTDGSADELESKGKGGVVRYYPGTFLEELRKITETLRIVVFPAGIRIRKPPEHKSEAAGDVICTLQLSVLNRFCCTG
jgi:hypothetical protein